MLAEERVAFIISELKERGYAKVEDLSNLLQVSEMTIRRDLEKCQDAGVLQRCHGGAILAGVSRQEVSFDDKMAENRKIKQQIALTCATFVKEGMSVFLDSGTTVFEIAQLIRTVANLTVVTSDIRILNSLLSSPVELLAVGGRVQKSTGSVIGQAADQMVAGMYFDIAFFGASCINHQLDVMTPTMEKTFFKNQVLQNATMSYLVTDASKFRNKALHRVNNLSDYTGIVTDCEFNAKERRLIEERSIRVIRPTISAQSDQTAKGGVAVATMRRDRR